MNRSASSVVLLASSLLCLPPSARSQNPAPAPTFTTTAPSNKPEEALRRLDHDDVEVGPGDALSFATMAAQAPPEQAIPAIERFYEKHKDDPPDEQLGVQYLRDNLASLLVQLGDPNPIHWNVLVSEADLALSSEIPYPNLTNGKTLEDSYTPEQKAWAKAHNMSLPQALREATLFASQRFAPLAKTGDPRSLPTLRTGLKSENLMIQSLAADGLGLLRDKDSIPVIIAICRTRQAPLSYFVASSLVYFHDPTADKVYHEYFPDRDIEQLRAQGDGPFVGGVRHHVPVPDASTPTPPRSESSAPDASPAPPPQTPPGLDTTGVPAPPHR
jgi:hypothetical protein